MFFLMFFEGRGYKGPISSSSHSHDVLTCLARKIWKSERGRIQFEPKSQKLLTCDVLQSTRIKNLVLWKSNPGSNPRFLIINQRRRRPQTKSQIQIQPRPTAPSVDQFPIRISHHLKGCSWVITNSMNTAPEYPLHLISQLGQIWPYWLTKENKQKHSQSCMFSAHAKTNSKMSPPKVSGLFAYKSRPFAHFGQDRFAC